MEISFPERGTIIGEAGFCCCLVLGGLNQEFSLGILSLRYLSDIQMETLSRLQDIRVLISGEKLVLKIDS